MLLQAHVPSQSIVTQPSMTSTGLPNLGAERAPLSVLGTEVMWAHLLAIDDSATLERQQFYHMCCI